MLSSMGAGAKADPTRIHIGTLSDVCYDPLASRLRWRMKKRNLDPSKIDVIYSSEKAQMKLLPLDADQAENPSEFGALPNFRVRVIPVLGTLPAAFGMAMASKVITDLAGMLYIFIYRSILLCSSVLIVLYGIVLCCAALCLVFCCIVTIFTSTYVFYMYDVHIFGLHNPIL
jgi:hypothetical protein